MDRSQPSSLSSPEAPHLKVVVFRLDGDLKQQGFKVELEVGMAGQPLVPSYKGQLTPMPQLVQQLVQWEQDYQNWGGQSRIRPKEVVFVGSGQPQEICRQSAQTLERSFNQWLQSPEFLKLDIRLRELVHQDDDTLVMLRTESEVLRKLPWHKWDFIDRYSNSEIVLSGTQVDPIQKLIKPDVPDSSPVVRILAILGDATGIDVESDRALLEQLPNADVTFLVEPDRDEINDQLWSQPWDILFFAGHSHTEEAKGRIYINQDDSLTLSELKYGLRKAIQQGLQLAIFNSCDGLGLAYELEQLSLPHLIVMREPVPDKVAQAFLTHFLPSFAQGNSLYRAMREARERLQGLENDFPCATWLPIVYQHPQIKWLTWQTIAEKNLTQRRAGGHPPASASPLEPASPPRRARLTADQAIRLGLVSSFIATIMVVGLRFMGFIEGMELLAFDQFIQLQPGTAQADERFLIIGINDTDIQYQDQQDMERNSKGSISDQALEQLLDKFKPYNPSTIGFDILHDFPFEDSLLDKLERNKFIAICQSVGEFSYLSGLNPPDNLPIESVGFNNVPVDPDGVIRRQFLGKPDDPVCPTQKSFNLQVAQQYLENNHDIKIEWVQNPNSDRRDLKLGQQIFHRFERRTGGYQRAPKEANGYQILVNYRRARPKMVFLKDILSGALDDQLESLVANRVVMIGVVDHDRDRHSIPYSKDPDTVPGVIIQAHMTSQILDAALGTRSLLSWWAEPWEMVWISGWAIIGTVLTLLVRSPWWVILNLGIGACILWGICFALFIQGWWVPLVPSVLTLMTPILVITILKQLRTHPQKLINGRYRG